MKFLAMVLLLLSFGAQAQKNDSSFVPVYRLVVQVKDLDNDKPLNDCRVVIGTPLGERIEYRTNDSGYVTIENILQRESVYSIEVSHSHYLTGDQQGSAKSQVSTVGLKKSMDFWKVFKLRYMYTCGGSSHSSVLFKKSSAIPEAGEIDSLQDFIDIVKKNNITLKIMAYTGKTASQALAKKRIEFLKNHLVNMGIPAKKILFKIEPAEPTDTVRMVIVPLGD